MSLRNSNPSKLVITPNLYDRQKYINHIKSMWIETKFFFDDNSFDTRIRYELELGGAFILDEASDETIECIFIGSKGYHYTSSQVESKIKNSLYNIYLIRKSKRSGRIGIEYFDYRDAYQEISKLDSRHFRLSDYYIFCTGSNHILKEFFTLIDKIPLEQVTYQMFRVYKVLDKSV